MEGMTPDLMAYLRTGTAPYPLDAHEANLHAYKLRTEHDLSYSTIAWVMQNYHGVRRGPDRWRRKLRLMGAPTRVVPGRVPPPPGRP